jgi:tRNA nucleotidyltransferase/poly(A) polymerase
MADYIFMLESRLTPEQLRGVTLVQDLARAQEMNVYLTGGAIRDLVSGATIRDLDFTVQGNALKLQRELERKGVVIQGVDDDLRSMFVLLPGNVRGEIAMARSERYEKPGKPPQISSATIIEDLRRRDFTVNAMALSLNPGSRGLLLDPANGTADIEAKLIRILHNYAFYEEPSRLIRATRFAHRFHWTLEERTQARYDAAKENNYIDTISDRAIGYEIEQIAYEEDPLHILRVLEKEGWLKVLSPHWTIAKVDTVGLNQLLKARQQMLNLGYTLDAAPAVMHFLTRRLGDREIAAMQRLLPRRSFVETWRNLESDAKALASRLTSKQAATPSLTWKLLSQSRPETMLFLLVTARQQAVIQKLRNFFTKWRQVKDKLPLPEMIELRITPDLPVYPKLAEEAFYLLLDGKLRSRTETLRFLKPHAPPPPAPPPVVPKRGRAAKAAAAAAAPPPTEQPVKPGRKAKQVAAAIPVQQPAPPPPAPAPSRQPVLATKKATKAAASSGSAWSKKKGHSSGKKKSSSRKRM